MIFMTFDHVADVLLLEVTWMRILGRIAMPLFAFTMAEGFAHTRNRKKYCSRMFLFAVLSEIPFDLAFFGKIYWGHQNIMFTFGLAILALICYETIKKEKKVLSYFGAVSVVIVFGVLAIVLKVDYNYYGILLVFLFYVLRQKRPLVRNGVVTLVQLLVRGVGIYVYSALSFLPLMLYNGKKGKGWKWLFYVFYPGHLLLLFLMKSVIG